MDFTEAHRSLPKLTVSYPKLPGISPKSAIFFLEVYVEQPETHREKPEVYREQLEVFKRKLSEKLTEAHGKSR